MLLILIMSAVYGNNQGVFWTIQCDGRYTYIVISIIQDI